MSVHHRTTILFATLVYWGATTVEGREPSLEELEMQYRLDHATRTFHKHDLSIEQISTDFEYRCLRSIGDAALCGCLVEKRPYILRFEQYVGISSRTKAELDYDTLSDSGRKIVDTVFRVRDDCVSG